VACDDASQDATVSILESFATRATFPVRIHRNRQRLGIGANFEQAIRLCNGDAIAICDQDDVWRPNKLALYAEAFAQGSSWVCCDADVTNRDLQPLGYSLWQRVKFNHAERQLARNGNFFDVLIKHHVVAGATLAFQAQMRNLLLPVPTCWHYDAWLATVLAATSDVYLIESPLQHYRQHGANALGAVRKNPLQEFRAALELDRQFYYAEEISRLNELATRLNMSGAQERIRSRIDLKFAHLRRRAALPVNRLARLPTIASEIWNRGYVQFSRNWGSVALDILVK
jgi:glycosyltransferase involved in cell wall biosynthesis